VYAQLLDFEEFFPETILLPWDFDFWVSRFAASARPQLLEAKRRFDAGLVGDKELSKATIFPKREPKNIVGLLDGTVQYQEAVDDRNINACSSALKVAVGPSCCAAAVAFARRCNSHNFIFFDYDADDEEIGDWYTRAMDKFGCSCCLELDCSRMDATQGVATMALGFDVLQSYGVPRRQMRILRLQLNNCHASSRNGVAFDRVALNRSGVPNTTLSNTIAVAAAFTVGVLRAGGNPREDMMLMIKGDDSLAFVKEKYVDSIRDTFATFGFKAKIKYGHAQCEHSFCSNVFYPVERVVGKSRRWLPGPTVRAVRKMFVTANKVPVKFYKSHIRGVCLGLRRIANHVPILHEVVETCLAVLPKRLDKYTALAIKEAKVKIMRTEAGVPDYLPEAWAGLAASLGVPKSAEWLKKATNDYCEHIKLALVRENPAGIVWSPDCEFLSRAIQALCT